MSAKTATREEKIMRLLLSRGSVGMDELLRVLNSSAPSIRRDLHSLEDRGLIRRTHGGATLIEPLLYEPFRHDPEFRAREQRAIEARRRIALAAADLIQPHETVGITAGTTTTQVGRALRRRADMNIVTNAINIGMELCNRLNLRCSITGGVLLHSWSFSLTGPAAIRFMGDVFLDRLLLDVMGIDAELGCTTDEPDEALTCRSMVGQARQVIVVADSGKLGAVSTALICPVSSVQVLVTDTAATREMLQPFEDLGVQVIKA